MKADCQPKERAINQREYPYLGVWAEKGNIRNSYIVMFTMPRTGVIVESLSENNPIGVVSDLFIEDEFRYYLGEIVISNEPL